MRKNCIKRILSGLLAVIAAVVFFVPPRSLEASTTQLDEIELYSITIDVNDDGSMNLNYEITWKVLDDQVEGPLTWVRIGVPTSYVSKVKATTDNVANASFQRSGDDTYIKVDFKDEYYAGAEVTFGFTCVMKNMYIIRENEVSYMFRPGWFSQIPVDSYVIRWNAEKVKSTNPDASIAGGYYTWTGSLAKGEKVAVSVVYSRDAYHFKEKINQKFLSGLYFVLSVLGIVFLAFGVFMLIYVRVQIGDDYTSDSFWGGGDSFFGGGDGGGGGSCACACACADGGRAGCSSKDFYGTKLESARVRARLKAQLKK